MLHEGAVVLVEHLGGVEVRLVHVFVALEHAVHHMQRVLRAVVGDRGVALRQVPHGERVDAQDVVERVGLDVSADAGVMRDLRVAFRRQVFVDVHEHRVHRVRGGLVEVDVAPADAERVRHFGEGAGRGFELLGRVAVEQRREAHIALRGADEAEGLHRGAGLERGLRGVVELLFEVIGTGVHRLDRTGFLIDGYAAHLQCFRHALGAFVAHLLDAVLQRLVNRGHYLVSARFELVLGEGLGIDQFRFHSGEQVAIRPREVVAECVLLDLRELGAGRFGVGDVAVLLHDADHTVEALLRLLGVLLRVPRARRGDDAGDHGRLGHGEVLGVLAEVRLRGGLDAVRAAPQVDRVHVIAQHFVFVLRIRDFHREDRLADLAGVRRGLAEVIPLRVLLRDRRATLA